MKLLIAKMIPFCVFIFLFVTAGALARPPPLDDYGGDSSQVSVSGFSSGGFMAVQVHVGYSAMFMGVGVVAAGPYFCAMNYFIPSVANGKTSPIFIDTDYLIQVTTTSHDIDATKNMKNDMVYMYTGREDETVVPGVVQELNTYYQAFVDSANIKMVSNISSGHAFITDNYGNACSTKYKTPFISDCEYNQAYDILNHIYGPDLVLPDTNTIAAGELLEFDQTEFKATFGTASLDDVGYIYVPSGCNSQSSNCRVHVSLHGCFQGRYFIGNKYPLHTGYNEVAELNNIIVIYPQVTVALNNFHGCWDWWGYTGPFYATKVGDQMKAIKAMVDRVLSYTRWSPPQSFMDLPCYKATSCSNFDDYLFLFGE